VAEILSNAVNSLEKSYVSSGLIADTTSIKKPLSICQGVEESLGMRHCFSLPALGVDCGFSLVNCKIE